MEGEILAVSFVSGIFGLIGLYMVNHNWFARRKLEQKYKLDRYKLAIENKDTKYTRQAARSELLQPQKAGMGSTIAALAPILNKLDGDQIMELKDALLGSGSESGSNDGSPLAFLNELPPEVITNLADRFLNNKNSPDPNYQGNTY